MRRDIIVQSREYRPTTSLVVFRCLLYLLFWPAAGTFPLSHPRSSRSSSILLVCPLIISTPLPALLERFHLQKGTFISSFPIASFESSALVRHPRLLREPTSSTGPLTSDLHCLQSFFSKKQSFSLVFSSEQPSVSFISLLEVISTHLRSQC